MRIQRDSGWAWIVLVCVICSQIILGGVCISGGIFYMIFMDVFPPDPIAVSWLCSLPITLWFISSPVGSYVTNRYGYRACAFIGGVIAATGLTLSYFATSLLFLFFSHGILTGLGFGINFTGCMATLNVYFDKYKTVATGISSVGHNLGIIIYAELIVLLDDSYGWRGMFLILGILLASTGSYEISFYIAGVSMVFSQVLMIYPIVHQKQRQKAHQNKYIYTVYEISVENCSAANTCIKPLKRSNGIRQEILSLEGNNDDILNNVAELDTLLKPENISSKVGESSNAIRSDDLFT
ncbi:monocarboxylate transporter 12-like isoform X3 [Mercenaria mercenaria]|uniref:monocarboxylate transporter 12-like isoform X3 n=1 Tax=Mercenaria mercenaria TaxID=6596 RepID=UPI00234FAF9C|nr:monocarboxylate transporter 12-like isoform X3 [Mercenaria mercenaria]